MKGRDPLTKEEMAALPKETASYILYLEWLLQSSSNKKEEEAKLTATPSLAPHATK